MTCKERLAHAVPHIGYILVCQHQTPGTNDVRTPEQPNVIGRVDEAVHESDVAHHVVETDGIVELQGNHVAQEHFSLDVGYTDPGKVERVGVFVESDQIGRPRK